MAPHSLVIVAVGIVASLAVGHSNHSAPRVYEDEAVKIAIPVDWTRVGGIRGENLVLQKSGYTLNLRYWADHASGLIGGRFIEAFAIPWLTVDDAWNCSTVLTMIPQPASRTLLFTNILMNTADPHVRAQCGIPKDLGKPVIRSINHAELTENKRWFGGYFTTGLGGYYFDESFNDTCRSKVFTLTSSAKAPEQLPVPEDTRLQSIIQESIDIVNAIHYKRCSPQPTSPFS